MQCWGSNPIHVEHVLYQLSDTPVPGILNSCFSMYSETGICLEVRHNMKLLLEFSHLSLSIDRKYWNCVVKFMKLTPAGT